MEILKGLFESLLSWFKSPAPPPVVTKPYSAEILRIHNLHRDGRLPLVLHPLLTRAAQKHADWMARKEAMSHRGEGFSSAGQRIKESGYHWSTYGENVAYGKVSPQEVMRVWLKSRGHRRNITNSAYQEIGVGYAVSAKGLMYWCVTFGSRGFGRSLWNEAECLSRFEE